MGKHRSLIKALAILMAVIAAIDVIWFSVTDFTFDWSSATTLAGLVFFMAVLGAYFIVARRSPKAQAFIFAGIFLIVMNAALAPLSYLMASINLPLIDAQLATLDKMLGFDWYANLALVNNHPTFGHLLTLAYESSRLQVLMLVIILALANQRDRLIEFFAGYALTLTIVIVLSGFFPAAGAYVYLKPAPELYANLNPAAGTWHLEQFTGLRDGTFRLISLLNIEGLVTFPSFHTALAIITTLAFRGMGPLFIAAILLNILVVMSTLSEGGHYLIDVIAGAVLAIMVHGGLRVWLGGFAAPLLQRLRGLKTPVRPLAAAE